MLSLRRRPLVCGLPLLAALFVASPASALQLIWTPRSCSVCEITEIDPSDGSEIGVVAPTITLAGASEAVRGTHGLAVNPVDQQLYVLLSLETTQAPRVLATLDWTTGVATLVGGTGDRFAGITFDAEGTLYGVTGDGASVPSSLFSLSTSDGSATFLLDLPEIDMTGDSGEVIGFNPEDGLLYRISGLGDDQVFQSIDPDTLEVTEISITGDTLGDEITAMVYDLDGGFLIEDQVEDTFFRIGSDGVVTELGRLQGQAKGMAFVPEPSTALLVACGVLGIGLRSRRGAARRR